MFEGLQPKAIGSDIRADEWNTIARSLNRLTGTTFGSGITGIHSGSIQTSSVQQEWVQVIARIKEKAKDSDDNEIADRWVFNIRYFKNKDEDELADSDLEYQIGEWKTDEEREYQLDTAEFPGKVKPGDTLVVYFDKGRGLYVPILAGDFFRVRNETGEKLEPFQIVGLREPIHPPGSNQDQSDGDGNEKDPDEDFKNDQGDMVAVKPVFPEYVQKWAITLTAIEEHEIGPACISGVCICKVFGLSFPNAGYANIDWDVVGGEVGFLTRAPYGRAQIVWHEPAEGSEGIDWAVVNLGNMTTPLFAVQLKGELEEDTSGTSAECELLLPDASGVDPNSDTIQVYDSLGLASSLVVGDKAWAWFNAGGTNQYEFLPAGGTTGIKLYQIVGQFTWPPDAHEPPWCYAVPIEWDILTISYLPVGGAECLYWPQCPRDASEQFVRCGGILTGQRVWASTNAGRLEIVDGLVWTSVVRLYSDWNYSTGTVRAEARVLYQSLNGYVEGDKLITVHLPVAPKDGAGNWIGLPRGGQGDVYTVTIEAQSCVVQAPLHIETVAQLTGNWTHMNAESHVQVKLFTFVGANGWAPIGKTVTAYYYGGPRSGFLGVYNVPIGPGTLTNQFCFVRYDYVSGKWEIISLFDPQHAFRGKLYGAWNSTANPLANVTVMTASGTNGPVVPAKGWGYKPGVNLETLSQVMLFYLPDDAGFYFCNSSSLQIAPIRGTISVAWSKAQDVSVIVTKQDGTGQVTARSWGFQAGASLIAHSEVWLFWDAPANEWYFMADTSGDSNVMLVKLYQAWDYSAPTPRTTAKIISHPQTEVPPGVEIQIYNPAAPRGTDGNYIGLPIGASGEIRTVFKNAEGLWDVANPEEVATVGRLIGKWTYNDTGTSAGIDVLLYAFAGTTFEKGTKTVRGYYAGLPRTAASNEFFKLSDRDAGESQFCFLRWRPFLKTWEIITVFNPQETFRGKLASAWDGGTGTVEIDVLNKSNQVIDGARLLAYAWGFASGSTLSVGANVFLFYLPDDARMYFMSAISGTGGPEMFVTVNFGSLGGPTTAPPYVEARRVKFINDGTGVAYTIDENYPNNETLYWYGAPRENLSGANSYMDCGRIPPGIRLWAQIRPGQSPAPQWHILDDPFKTFTVKLTTVWDYGATGNPLFLPTAEAKIWFYDPVPVVGSPGWRLGNHATAIVNPAAPLAQDGTYIGIPVGREDELYTVRMGQEGRLEIIPPRELVASFRLIYISEWDYPSGVNPNEEQCVVEILKLVEDKYTSTGKRVILKTQAGAKVEDGSWAQIIPGRLGMCRWLSGVNWEVVSFFSATYVFRMTAPWDYPPSPRSPFCKGLLCYIDSTGTYQSSPSEVSIFSPQAARVNPAADAAWAKVPKGAAGEYGWCRWNGDNLHWELIGMIMPMQVYRGTINGDWDYNSGVAKVSLISGVVVDASSWGFMGSLKSNTRVFVEYEPDVRQWYLVTPPGDTRDAVTKVELVGLNLKQTTRPLHGLWGKDSDETTTIIFTATNCPPT